MTAQPPLSTWQLRIITPKEVEPLLLASMAAPVLDRDVEEVAAELALGEMVTRDAYDEVEAQTIATVLRSFGFEVEPHDGRRALLLAPSTAEITDDPLSTTPGMPALAFQEALARRATSAPPPPVSLDELPTLPTPSAPERERRSDTRPFARVARIVPPPDPPLATWAAPSAGAATEESAVSPTVRPAPSRPLLVALAATLALGVGVLLWSILS